MIVRVLVTLRVEEFSTSSIILKKEIVLIVVIGKNSESVSQSVSKILWDWSQILSFNKISYRIRLEANFLSLLIFFKFLG